MELESARELSDQLASSFAESWQSDSPDSGGGYAVMAQAIERQEGPLRTVAVGVTKKGRADYAIAVRLQRRDAGSSETVERVREAAHGEIDVRYVGRVLRLTIPWYRQRQRPLLIGSSIGHYRVTAGTLGALVRDTRANPQLILSNNHVLANENRGNMGDPILQPGRFDHGRSTDQVGTLDRWVPLLPSGNRVDAALAAVGAGLQVDPSVQGVGRLAGSRPIDPDNDDQVEKIGRTTGHTLGHITAFDVKGVVIGYDSGNRSFDGQLEVEGQAPQSFSDGGDSGSLVFTSSDHYAIGLLFAGSDHGGPSGLGLSYANPLSEVLQAFSVQLVV